MILKGVAETVEHAETWGVKRFLLNKEQFTLNSAVAVHHKDRKEHKGSRLQRLQFGMITHPAINLFLTELRSNFLSMCSLCFL